MTLEEAIKHAEEVAEKNEAVVRIKGEYAPSCAKRAEEHRQLAEWLKEYRLMKQGGAIPKADYENRLKADMVAMLTEIQLELDEMKITKVRSAGFAPYSKDPFRRGVNCSKEIIQQKINALKGAEQ